LLVDFDAAVEEEDKAANRLNPGLPVEIKRWIAKAFQFWRKFFHKKLEK